MDLSEQPGSGAAQRRRQRRLRSWLRHERMTVAMALAERTHHSSRGQTIARAGVWAREIDYTATIWDPPPPTPQPELFSLEEEPGGARWDRMPSLSGPQERVQRRTVQQIVDHVPLLPTLDDPAPQLVEHFPDILHFLRALSPILSRLSKCPRSCPWTSLCELRFASRSWWNSWLKCRRSYPSPRGLRSRTSTFQLLVVVEVVEVFPFSPRTALLYDCRADL